jgi:hypothetical protein
VGYDKATGMDAISAFYLSMKLRFLHIGLLVLLLLLGVVSSASAQKDSIEFTPTNELNVGSVPFGSTKTDSLFVKLTGAPRQIFTAVQPGLSLISPSSPYDFKSSQTLIVRFQISPQRFGTDTLYLTMYDTVTAVSDTALIIVNGTQGVALRTNPDTIRVGKLLTGATLLDSFYIVNNGAPIGLNRIFTLDAQQDSVQILSPLPIHLGTGDSTLIRFQIEPTALGLRVLHLRTLDSSNKPVLDATVLIEGIAPSAPQPSFVVDPLRKDVFAAIIESDNASFEIYLKNTSDSALVINNVSFDSSPYYQLSYDPDTLATGDSILIKLDLVTPGTGFYPTVVRVPNEGGLASEYTLGVQVLRVAPNSVPVIRTRSGIRIAQSYSDIFITDLPFETGTLRIVDILGREIASHSINSSNIVVPKLDAKGDHLQNGYYIIRVADARGRYSESLKVIILSE